MELLALLKLGTPVLVLGMLVFLERINSKVNTIAEDVAEIRSKITWKDTCDERHDDIDRRLGNLEKKTGLNGSAQPATDTR